MDILRRFCSWNLWSIRLALNNIGVRRLLFRVTPTTLWSSIKIKIYYIFKLTSLKAFTVIWKLHNGAFFHPSTFSLIVNRNRGRRDSRGRTFHISIHSCTFEMKISNKDGLFMVSSEFERKYTKDMCVIVAYGTKLKSFRWCWCEHSIYGESCHMFSSHFIWYKKSNFSE